MQSLSKINFLAPIFNHWDLVRGLSARQVTARYRGSSFGLFWAVLTPLMLLAMYTFVFSVVFAARWDVYLQDKTNFALFLFAGLSAHSMIAEAISRAPGLVHENKAYVKKIRFPLEALSWISIMTALVGTTINFSMLFIIYLVMFGLPPMTVFLLPLVLIPLIFLSLGASWLLSALAVFWRDVRHMTGIVVLLFLFLTPIFYPIQAVPSSYAKYIGINPMATIVDMVRKLLFFGEIPPLIDWIGLTIFSMVIACFGYWFFNRVSGAFADVI